MYALKQLKIRTLLKSTGIHVDAPLTKKWGYMLSHDPFQCLTEIQGIHVYRKETQF